MLQTWDQILFGGFCDFCLVFLTLLLFFMCMMYVNLFVSGLGGRFIGWAVLNPHWVTCRLSPLWKKQNVVLQIIFFHIYTVCFLVAVRINVINLQSIMNGLISLQIIFILEISGAN